MNFLKKLIALTTVLSVFCLYFPAAVFAKPEPTKNITKHPVKISTLPEVKIPVETVEKQKINKWVWIGLGVLAAGGVAAAAASRGGDDSPPPPPTPQGDLEVTW